MRVHSYSNNRINHPILARSPAQSHFVFTFQNIIGLFYHPPCSITNQWDMYYIDRLLLNVLTPSHSNKLVSADHLPWHDLVMVSVNTWMKAMQWSKDWCIMCTVDTYKRCRLVGCLLVHALRTLAPHFSSCCYLCFNIEAVQKDGRWQLDMLMCCVWQR